MILELLASLVIQTSNIKEANVNLGDNYNNHNFTLGDSLAQREQRERERLDEIQRSNRQVIARTQTTEASRGESYTGTGGYVEIIGEDTQYFNCVKYAKAKTGISRSIGNGGRKGINSQIPHINAIGVEKNRSHAVVIEKIEGDKITVTEANYYRGWITRRVLNGTDFIGFII